MFFPTSTAKICSRCNLNDVSREMYWSGVEHSFCRQKEAVNFARHICCSNRISNYAQFVRIVLNHAIMIHDASSVGSADDEVSQPSTALG